MHGLYVLSVWLHILAASVWVGGMVFFAAVLVPMLRSPKLSDQVGALVHELGVRFRTVGWACLLLLIATGLYNLHHRAMLDDLLTASFWATPFGQTLGIKLVLVGIVLAISGIHDFYVGPRATQLLRQDPTDPAAQKFRKAASRIGRANLLLGLAVVVLAVALVRGNPW